MKAFKKKIGILGGAGPGASAYAYTLLTRIAQKNYQAVDDTDFPETFVYSLPLLSFSVHGIEEKDTVRQQVLDALMQLKNWGVNIGLIACNSLHVFYDEMSEIIDFSLVSLPEAGASLIARQGHKRVAILSSQSARRDGVHEQHLKAFDIETLYPNEEQQAQLNRIIQHVMAGTAKSYAFAGLKGVANQFTREGAQALLVGCTELSLLTEKMHLSIPVVDCLHAALSETLKIARA